ncbi:MAG: radical SAM family heme chaperone HemW [Thermodesulfobacteriota bacterium]
MTDAQPGLYLHVPFCSAKCPYCDFYSLAAPNLIQPWLEGLERETRLYQNRFAGFDTVYLGGGTPSRLPVPILAQVLALLRSSFPIEPGAEVTLEANPEDVTPELVKTALAGGVNRFSLGVQSFHDRELELLGRRHSSEKAARAIEIIRAAGVNNLGLDLMYGLPDQNLADWFETLAQAVSFNPEHLSCYQLTVEEGSIFARSRERNRLNLPDEEASRGFFLATARFLEARGYLHYEVSNFARGPGHRSRHNHKYWRHAPYLGLGPAAHSYKDGVRWWNHRSIREYCRDLIEGRRPAAGSETLTEEQTALEKIYLGLRTKDGLDLGRLDRSGRNLVRTWERRALATVNQGRIVLTVEGLAVADHLAVELA